MVAVVEVIPLTGTEGQACPAELRERAIRLVEESVRDGRSKSNPIGSATEKLGIGSVKTARKWVKRQQAMSTPAVAKAARSHRNSSD